MRRRASVPKADAYGQPSGLAPPIHRHEPAHPDGGAVADSTVRRHDLCRLYYRYQAIGGQFRPEFLPSRTSRHPWVLGYHQTEP